MDRQAIFDKVTTHLLTQNQPAKRVLKSYDNAAECAYRGENGTQCAVGCLIADEDYTPAMEGGAPTGHTAACDLVRAALERSLGCPLDGEDLQFLRRLQNVHDENGPGDWSQELEAVAETYALAFNPPH